MPSRPAARFPTDVRRRLCVGEHRRSGVTLALLLTLTACAGSTPPGDDSSAVAQQYAGLEEREVKALESSQIEDLLNGRGAGYALAAELNHYPGPTHVLELADELDLSREQRAAVSAVKASMQEEARRLGAELVAAEQALDTAFAKGRINTAELAELAALTAEVEGRLRTTHLAAHIETRGVLTEVQVARYDELRGYASPSAPGSPREEHTEHGD